MGLGPSGAHSPLHAVAVVVHYATLALVDRDLSTKIKNVVTDALRPQLAKIRPRAINFLLREL